MRVFHIPINTASLLAAGLWEEDDFEAILSSLFKGHILVKKEDSFIFFYITHNSPGFKRALERFCPDWVGYEFVIRDKKLFSDVEAERLLSQKVRSLDDTTVVMGIPTGFLTKTQKDKLLEKLADKWGKYVVYDLPPPKKQIEPAIR